MYNVSDSFRTISKRPAQCRRLYGTIGSVPFTQENVLQGTFTITNQCSDDTNIQIGQVYVGELKATFRNLNIPRNDYRGREIVPYNGLLLDDNSYEDVLLGHYFIDSATWTSAGVEVIAYDSMSKFDKQITLDTSQGTVYDFVMLACKTCKVICNMTSDDFALFPNGELNVTIYEDNDIETWRDLISWCAQTIGANAIVDRDGYLIFKQYSQTIVDTFDDTCRLDGSKISDFVSYYTGVSMVNIAKQTTEYYGAEEDDGLTMNLGQNPLLQYGLPEALEKERRAILDAVMQAKYVPSTIRPNTPLIYDLMDVIELSGGLVGETPIITCITKYTWKFIGDYEITCVGSDPALMDARSKADKNIAGLMSQVSRDSLYYYDYINAESVHVGDGENAELLSFRYASTEETRINFVAEVNFDVTSTEDRQLTEDNDIIITEHDVQIKITYYLDGEEIVEYHPRETITNEGMHLLHLIYNWKCTSNAIGVWKVVVEVVGGSLDFDVACIRANINGQGLVGDGAQWDGTITLKDEVGTIDVAALCIANFVDNMSIGTQVPYSMNMNDSIVPFNVYDIIVNPFVGSVSDMCNLHRFDVLNGANRVTTNNVVVSGSVWKVRSGVTSGTLDTSNCTNTNTILQVTSICSGDDVSFIVSFDGGEVWWTYKQNQGWTPPDYTQDIYGMFESTMSSITSEQWAEKLDGSIMVRAILTGKATVTDIQIYTEDLL